MKFGQLIQYNMGNFFEKRIHTQNEVEKVVPDPFIKIQKQTDLWIYNLKCYKVYFNCMSKHVIDWLPIFLEILDNICIVIICCPVCDVMNFEINLRAFIETKQLFFER